VGVRPFFLGCGDDCAGSRNARLGVRLARLPLARHRGLSIDHHASDDLCADACFLPKRHGVRRQQRDDRLQGHPGLGLASAEHPARPLSRVHDGARRRVSVVPVRHDFKARPGAAGIARCREPGALSRLFGHQRKALCLHAVGCARRHCRRALCPAGRDHQPERILSRQFDRDCDLGVGRRPRDVVGSDRRRGAGQSGQDLVDRSGARNLALRPRRVVCRDDPGIVGLLHSARSVRPRATAPLPAGE